MSVLAQRFVVFFTALFCLAPSALPQFTIERIAQIDGARELTISPQGDLYAGTRGGDVYVVPNAEGSASSSSVFASPGDDPAAGVSYMNGTLYIATQHAIWRVAAPHGVTHATSAPGAIAHVRSGEAPPGSDGDVHTTTSVAAFNGRVYASVGSSCNACVEIDPTRATIGEVRGGRYVVIARRIRNAIALAGDERGILWASDAGQDELPVPHPYEFFDDVGARVHPVDYGWPFCYDNRRQKPGTHEDCSRVAAPRVIFPAYETPIGAAFYPSRPRGRFAFPAQYRGGAFVSLHGSWHGPAQGLAGYLPPRVVFVPMRDGKPLHQTDWNNPSTQWTEFIGGYQQAGTRERSGRPTGVAVGPQGSLFVADDLQGAIYRVRPRR